MTDFTEEMAAETSLAMASPVAISRLDFEQMLEFSRLVFGLKDNAAYLAELKDMLPAAASIKTGWPSVLMGFDFHLTPDGPRLIEINNNAGGLYIGQGHWLPQPELSQQEWADGGSALPTSLQDRLAAMFPEVWQSIAIMDEDVEQQYMYPEMCAYADLLRLHGRQVFLVSPANLKAGPDGLSCEGIHIDAIYNRHTDFYLESQELAHIRMAYEQGKVVLNPHPRSYALIGDKSRMVDWWQPGLLEACLDEDAARLIRRITPETRRLLDMDREKAWEDRKNWVFKPAARHGGKGVLLGRAMSRKRFDSLDVADTIVQQLVPASEVDISGHTMKLDIRLYMHGADLIALAGRVWRGQVTNFREPGSGWVALAIES